MASILTPTPGSHEFSLITQAVLANTWEAEFTLLPLNSLKTNFLTPWLALPTFLFSLS